MMFQESSGQNSGDKNDNFGNEKNEQLKEKDLDLQKKYRMSDRQFAIARLIADGATNREIAKVLSFSESTARYETIKIYERLQVKNRAQAAAMIRTMIGPS